MNPRIAASVLVVLGCLQMFGDVTGLVALRTLGAVLHASPAPKVFTAHDGFETYSSTFHVDWQEEGGKWHTLELTPQAYRGLQGPYNRRNAYGAAISYAPVLVSNPRTRPMLSSVARFGFCGSAPLLSELGIPRDRVVYPLYVRLEPRDGASRSPKWQREFRISCD